MKTKLPTGPTFSATEHLRVKDSLVVNLAIDWKANKLVKVPKRNQ